MHLDTVIGQDVALGPVKRWARERLEPTHGLAPRPKCWVFLGDPGIGKSLSASMLAKDLGCTDPMSGLHEVTGSELSIDKCRQLFDRDLRLMNMFGGKEKVLVIEELELISPAAQVFLKVNLENLPKNTTVIATSNDLGKLQYAFVERFHIRKFDSTVGFRMKFVKCIETKWHDLCDKPLPDGYRSWGARDGKFSARLAIRELETAIAEVNH